MSEQSCSACNDLREYAPEFVVNGVTENVCEHLANNEGLSGADGHVDCDDLHDVNDCLVGNLNDEVDAFDVCEWKDFMHLLIPNSYETLKAMICSMCGQWDDIECLKKKIDAVTFNPIVAAFRHGNVPHVSVSDETEIGTIKVYIDANESSAGDSSPSGTYGSKPADRDYIAFVTWCSTAYGLDNEETSIQVSLRNNTQSASYGQNRAQHYSVKGVTALSLNQTGFCYLPKGSYLLIRQYCTEAPSGAMFRAHQFSMVLLPVITPSIVC